MRAARARGSATTRMSNAALVNFAAGESSPRSRGRFDIPSFLSSCRKLLNFIAETAGPARFRPGFKRIRETRGGAVARMILFQLNDSQAYMLEFTNGKMRVYKNEELLTRARTTVTAITQANPAVITVASTANLVNGDEVIITGIVGMIELNGRQVKLAGSSGSTFQLVDPTTGANINSTSFGAYSSGGTLVEVYEIDSPYLGDELDDIQFTQSRNVMYLAHLRYTPRKIEIVSADEFTLSTYVRTSDPFFESDPVLVVQGVTTPDTQTQVQVSGVVNPNVAYTFSGVGGTTQINGGVYFLVPVPSSFRYYIKTASGAFVDSTTWSTFTSAGIATPVVENPIAVAFYEGRLGFFGTNQRPNTFFLSRAPDDGGVARYDDFTGGVDPDHACFFALAPTSGRVDFIAWAVGMAKHLLVGTFGGPFRISGGGIEEPITPSSINVRQIDGIGCEASVPAIGARAFFIQRGGTTLRTVRFNADIDDLESYDMCLNAEHIGEGGLRRVVLQTGRPDIVWVLRTDGILAGMTVQGSENIAGWHRHKAGGTAAKIIDVAVLPRPDKDDQLWVVVERTVNGATRRAVEIMADDVFYPDSEDFYSGPDNAAGDAEKHANALYRLQERYVHVDGAGTYDGSDRGDTAAATLTPGAVTGTGISFTASTAVFLASDVGNELWKKPSATTGIGSGRAVITAYVSPTVVTGTILVDFDTTAAIAAGEWHIAAETITGLWPLEGQTVAVVTDGAVYSDGRGDAATYPVVTVANGKVTLTDPAAVVHIGLPYEGILQTQNLEMGGRTGPAQDKPRNIVEMFIRFLNTLGVDYGTDIYRMDQVHHRENTFVTSRPSPVFSGIRKLHHSDNWEAEQEKKVVVSQRLPLPCVVQFIDMRYDTSDE